KADGHLGPTGSRAGRALQGDREDLHHRLQHAVLARIRLASHSHPPPHRRLELVSGYLAQGWMKITAGSWRQDPKLSGGGQAYDSGAHILNSLCWSVESDIAEVFAFIDQHGTPVDINSSINLRFTNGAMANIVVSGNCPADGAAMHFMFENGRVVID